MIALTQTKEGLVFEVQARPGAKRNGVTGEHAGRLKVAVTQAPEKGKANQAIIEVLAAALGVKRSQITLVAGATASQKRFLVTGVDATDLAAQFERLIS